MITDAELLRRYAEERTENAFAELVQRHLGIVYSSALRRTNGNRHLAEEIAQKVFTDLAKKAAALKSHPALTGWLYRTTRYAAIDLIRSERRRQVLAQNCAAMSEPLTPTDSHSHLDWNVVRPVVDEAMDQLKDADRELMLLRFFHGLSFSEVGQRLRLTENAARMRTDRALEKLRRYLNKRGVTSTAAALGLLLTNEAAGTTPTGLSTLVTNAAVAASPATGIANLTTLLLMSKLTAPIASAFIAAGLTAILCTSTAKNLDPEIASLRRENFRLAQATANSGSADSIAKIADEYANQAAAIANSLAQRHSEQTEVQGAVARPEITPRGHRDRGMGTPHDAAMTFAYACDTADPAALAKCLYFDETTRAEASKMLATMPDALRAQYPTPEAFYGLCLAAACLEAPPPGADLMERFMVIAELGPSRFATRRLGSDRNIHEYQKTSDGWKYVVPLEAVKYAPLNLRSEVLTKLGNK